MNVIRSGFAQVWLTADSIKASIACVKVTFWALGRSFKYDVNGWFSYDILWCTFDGQPGMYNSFFMFLGSCSSSAQKDSWWLMVYHVSLKKRWVDKPI